MDQNLSNLDLKPVTVSEDTRLSAIYM